MDEYLKTSDSLGKDGDIQKAESDKASTVTKGEQKYQLFAKLRDTFTEANPDIPKQSTHKKATELWNATKRDPLAVEKKIEE